MASPSAPTLLTPTNSAKVIGNILIFTFTVPTDTDNDKLVFKVEFDTNSVINPLSPNYKYNESRLSADQKVHGKWEAKNDSNVWVTLPTGGIDSTFYGNDARLTLRKQDCNGYPNSSEVWYWQMLCSDNMGQNPVFNQCIFAQVRFA